MAKYLVYKTKNRASGTLMELYDSNHPENTFAKPDGRWVVLCTDHNNWRAYAKQGDAFKGMTNPGWCAKCKLMLDDGSEIKAAAKEGFEPFKEAKAARARKPVVPRSGIFSLHKNQTGLEAGQFRIFCMAGMHMFVADSPNPETCPEGHSDVAGGDNTGEAGQDPEVDLGTDILD